MLSLHWSEKLNIGVSFLPEKNKETLQNVPLPPDLCTPVSPMMLLITFHSASLVQSDFTS
jgi:hypothetical protein